MYESLFLIGIVLAVMAAASLAASIGMFFGFKVPTLWKDWNGALEQKQIEEIRQKNSAAANQRGKVNVFEELEKKAKLKKPNTQSLSFSTTASRTSEDNKGTSLLKRNMTPADPNFVIEKSIIFVSTDEVI